MRKGELEKALNDTLVPFFEQLNFQFAGGPTHRFRMSIDKDIVGVYFNVFSDGRVSFSKIRLSVNAVEDVILQIGMPSMDLSSYRSGEHYLPTISDQRRFATDTASEQAIKGSDELNLFFDSVKQYMTDQAISFVEHYRHLPNILNAVDDLEKNGKYWRELFGGGPEHFFRVLIISRICSDPKHTLKVKTVDSLFYDKTLSLDEWIPYYEKLKERLLTLEPKYKYET